MKFRFEAETGGNILRTVSFLFILSFCLTLSFAENCIADDIVHSSKNQCTRFTQDILDYREYISKIQKERALLYNALNLSDEQIKIKEDLFNKNAPALNQKLEQLQKETVKLRALKTAGADNCDICFQKNKVKEIKKETDKILKEENKEFKKCLTRAQRAKYSMIKKLNRRDYRKSLHPKDYYKSNPQMRRFGNPAVPECDEKS